jgi:hypothetical protein
VHDGQILFCLRIFKKEYRIFSLRCFLFCFGWLFEFKLLTIMGQNGSVTTHVHCEQDILAQRLHSHKLYIKSFSRRGRRFQSSMNFFKRRIFFQHFSKCYKPFSHQTDEKIHQIQGGREIDKSPTATVFISFACSTATAVCFL